MMIGCKAGGTMLSEVVGLDSIRLLGSGPAQLEKGNA